MLKYLVLVLGLVVATTTASAGDMSRSEAQACANRLLQAYNTRVYPTGLLDERRIIARTYGSTYRSLTKQVRARADQIALDELKDSFINPTGKYEYSNLVIDTVTRNSRGLRADGQVHLVSPKYTGPVHFTALTVGNQCKIYQVRLGELYSLDTSLRAVVLQDPALRLIKW